jgi:hypothetical protein
VLILLQKCFLVVGSHLARFESMWNSGIFRTGGSPFYAPNGEALSDVGYSSVQASVSRLWEGEWRNRFEAQPESRTDLTKSLSLCFETSATAQTT